MARIQVMTNLLPSRPSRSTTRRKEIKGAPPEIAKQLVDQVYGVGVSLTLPEVL
jgi:hypothetical protein